MKRTLFLVVALLVPVAAAPRQQPAAITARAAETALDRYVAAPDASYAWSVAKSLPSAEGTTATLIDLTSQKWLEPEV